MLDASERARWRQAATDAGAGAKAQPAGTPGGHYSGSDADTALRDADAVHHFVDAQWRALRDAANGAGHAG